MILETNVQTKITASRDYTQKELDDIAASQLPEDVLFSRRLEKQKKSAIMAELLKLIDSGDTQESITFRAMLLSVNNNN